MDDERDKIRQQEEEEEDAIPLVDIEEGDEILGSKAAPPIKITGRVSDKVYVEKGD